MKNLILIFGFVSFIATAAFAGEAVGNKICPISGEEIGVGAMKGQEATVEYKDKTYRLCCPMCKKSFLADPESAIKKLEEKKS